VKVSKEDKDSALGVLKSLLVKGDRVYGIVRSVARSGMSRTIDFYILKDNQPVYLTTYMSVVLSIPQAKNGALRVAGCGMDMIFATVYELSMRLFSDGYWLKCGSL
jgi:hypothetical protein